MRYSQLETFFTKMKNDIGELNVQNAKLIEEISDLNDRVQHWNSKRSSADADRRSIRTPLNEPATSQGLGHTSKPQNKFARDLPF